MQVFAHNYGKSTNSLHRFVCPNKCHLQSFVTKSVAKAVVVALMVRDTDYVNVAPNLSSTTCL